jgi:glycosyltransferase involved in cell wall biosynthesis
MKILYVLPRNMYFGSRSATSIDLCCRDLINSSIYGPSTHVLASPVEDRFLDMDIHPFPASADKSTRKRVSYAKSVIKRARPDLVVVQQHLPSAAAIARKVRVPVILHRHNFQKSYESVTFTGRLRRGLKLRAYKALAGVIHVSQTCEAQFSSDWPEVATPRTVVPNCFDSKRWQPAVERTKEVLCVGRCAPEKGILETAHALTTVLPDHPEWRARFILSAVDAHPDYYAEVLSTLAPVNHQTTVQVQLPYEGVVAAYERAAIAIVASKWNEPFGRTALEAHAGGAALISSGTGGLREISGNHALYVDAVEPNILVEAIHRLISEPQLCNTMAQSGRKRVELLYTNYAVSAQADAFFELIHQRHCAPKSRSKIFNREESSNSLDVKWIT